jgi:hypothetical protein
LIKTILVFKPSLNIQDGILTVSFPCSENDIINFDELPVVNHAAVNLTFDALFAY